MAHLGANLDVITNVNDVLGSSIDLRTKSVHLRVDDRQPRLWGLLDATNRSRTSKKLEFSLNE